MSETNAHRFTLNPQCTFQSFGESGLYSINCENTRLVIKEWVYQLAMGLDNMAEADIQGFLDDITMKYGVADETVSSTVKYLLAYKILNLGFDNSEKIQFSVNEDAHVLNNVLHFSYKKTIITETTAQKFGKHFRHLFSSICVTWIIIVFVILTLVIFFSGICKYKLLIDPHQTLIYGALCLPAVIILNWIKTFFHEFGHIGATIKCGEKPGEIGFGIYMFTPVLYSNVCNANTLDRKKRLIVDMGGIIVDCLLLSCSAIAVLLIDNIFVYSIQFVLLANEFNNFDPFKKTDGYWIYSDYFNLPNLHNRVEEMLIGLKPQMSKKEQHYVHNMDKAVLVYGIYCLGIILLSVCSGIVFLPTYIKRYPMMLSEYWDRLVAAFNTGMISDFFLNLYLIASLLLCVLGFALYLKRLVSFAWRKWRVKDDGGS